MNRKILNSKKKSVPFVEFIILKLTIIIKRLLKRNDLKYYIDGSFSVTQWYNAVIKIKQFSNDPIVSYDISSQSPADCVAAQTCSL